ncbi:response regulator [Synechocystis sp. LKSZ1]|uniref:response regulator n=1 Tax=Synechocystis sp. LKSZ1 TaxID=3144951 RepID=UPI00336BDB49
MEISALSAPLFTNIIIPEDNPMEIPHKLIHQLVEEQVTGKLIVQNPFDEFVFWQIYFGKGKIHFASSLTGFSDRLIYMLGDLIHHLNLQVPPYIKDDYQYISSLWKRGVFSFQQTRSILEQFTTEALVHIMSLPKTKYHFTHASYLDTLFLNLDIQQITPKIQSKVGYWWQVRSKISSPFQRPLVHNWQEVDEIFEKRQLTGTSWVKPLKACLEDLNSLYLIAGKTRLNTLKLAFLFHPLIQTGAVTMLPHQEIKNHHSSLIAYVDTSPIYQHQIRYILGEKGIKLLCIEDPFKALAVLQSRQPELLFVRADMEGLDGYEITALCHKSPHLAHLPIVVLTHGNNLIDKLRIKLSGASGSLGIPFLPNDILQMVEQQLRRPLSA